MFDITAVFIYDISTYLYINIYIYLHWMVTQRNRLPNRCHRHLGKFISVY